MIGTRTTEYALGSVAPLLGASEAVTIESLRLLGTIVAALAAVYGAWSARQGSAEARKTRREVRRRRRKVRDGDQLVIVDEPDEGDR